MKRLTPPIRWPVLVALVLPLALTACDKPADDDDLGAGKNPVAAGEQLPADTTITAKVSTALAADDKLHALQIAVDTHNGQVTLSGMTPDTQSRDRAVALASAVDGVKRVNNQLVIGRTG